MKKHIRTTLSVLCLLALALSLAPAALAETATESHMYDYTFDFGNSPLDFPFNVTGAGHYVAYNADGNVAYCIDRGNGNATGYQPNQGADWAGVSYGDRRTIALALLYGYDGYTKYGYAADTERAATQMMVWAIIGGYYNNAMESTYLQYAITGAFTGQVLDVYAKMKSQILSHYSIPSFCTPTPGISVTYETTYSAVTGLHSVTLTDTAGQLAYFNIVAAATAKGYTASVSGNRVTISSATPILTADVIGATRTANTYQNPLLVRSIGYLAGNAVQNKVMTYGSRVTPDPVPAYFGLLTNTKDIVIEKTDSETGEPVEGAVFELYDDAGNLLATMMTDENGVAVFEQLYYSDYTIIELTPAVGYQENDTEHSYKLNASSGTLKLTNDIKKGQIQLTKRSSFDNKLLEGATYGIYRMSDDVLMEEITTDDTGVATSSLLRYGQYYVLELDAPPRYHIDENQHPVFVGETHLADVPAPVADAPIIGRFNLSYTPHTGSIKVGEQGLGVPNTGVPYYVTDDEILGYPVPPKIGETLSIDEMQIEYLRIEDDPVYIAQQMEIARIKEDGINRTGGITAASLMTCCIAALVVQTVVGRKRRGDVQ